MNKLRGGVDKDAMEAGTIKGEGKIANCGSSPGGQIKTGVYSLCQ